MARVMRCDRCGKIYEIENCNIKIVVQYVTGSNVCRYDLCPDCVEHFRFDFMRSENNETEEEAWSITEEMLGLARIDLNTCLEKHLSRVHNDLVKTGGDL